MGYSQVRDAHGDLLARDEPRAEVRSLLARGHNVLLFGPSQIGKTALIAALGVHRAVVLDPFQHVSSQLAGRILRGMDRGTSYLAAARSLDRHYLGAVRRIAWRFTSVRIPPLPDRCMKQLIEREWTARCPMAEVPSAAWIRTFLRLADGRPGFAIAMIQLIAQRHEATGTLPSPALAYTVALIRNADLSSRRALENGDSRSAAET